MFTKEELELLHELVDGYTDNLVGDESDLVEEVGSVRYKELCNLGDTLLLKLTKMVKG